MDLTTNYLGMQLKNPLVPSASPLSRSLEMARIMESAGASALIMYSLFEEAVTAEEEAMVRFLHHQETGFGEADGFLPDHMDFPGELDRYLEQVAALEIPLIASLNGVTTGGWIDHAREIQDAGADALELNVYYIAADIDQPGSQVEQRYLELLKQLKQHISIPINMKLSSAFSSVSNMVKQLEEAGAQGVSLFNRFYQPDIDIHNLRLTPLPAPLHFIRGAAAHALDRAALRTHRTVTGRHQWGAHGG
jgi:dihydroorotate dehydrogenase (fumarate)